MPSQVSVFKLISSIESNENSNAIRFEPLVYKGLKFFTPRVRERIVEINECDEPTAEIISSSSWGSTQIMGFNLYGVLGGVYSIGEFLNRDDLQRLYFHKYLQSRKINFTINNLKIEANRKIFAIRYNGSVSYASHIEHALKVFGEI